jgi:hypothetical protein
LPKALKPPGTGSYHLVLVALPPRFRPVGRFGGKRPQAKKSGMRSLYTSSLISHDEVENVGVDPPTRQVLRAAHQAQASHPACVFLVRYARKKRAPTRHRSSRSSPAASFRKGCCPSPR